MERTPRNYCCSRGYRPLGVMLLILLTGCTANPFPDAGSFSFYDSKPTRTYQAVQPVTVSAGPDIRDVQANTITRSSATITWTTGKPSSGLVQWGTTADYEFTTQAEGEPDVQQSVNLKGLKPDTTYHYRIALKGQSGAPAVSPDQTFMTLQQLNTTPPVISHISIARITGTAATITWATDKPASGQIEYGETGLYGASTMTEGSLAYDHSFVLLPLSPGTVYHYRILSKDIDGDAVVSTDQVLKTADLTDGTAPVISNISATDITTASATINWVTSELATSQVEYDTNLSYGNITQPDGSMVTDHAVTLSDLDIGKAYHFRVKSMDSSGNLSTSPDTLFITSTAPRMAGVTPLRNPRCRCHYQ